MPEPTPSVEQIRAGLHDLARDLRQADHLEPQAQRALADLLEELNRVLGPAAPPSAETAHLADSVAQLARALHEQHHPSLLEAARNRLQEAAVRAENAAPIPVGMARRLIETLANLGI